MRDTRRANVVDMLAQLLWGPKTAQELRQATGASDRCIGDWLRAMRQGGVVRKVGRVICGGMHHNLYELQIPFNMPDGHEVIWPDRRPKGLMRVKR